MAWPMTPSGELCSLLYGSGLSMVTYCCWFVWAAPASLIFFDAFLRTVRVSDWPSCFAALLIKLALSIDCLSYGWGYSPSPFANAYSNLSFRWTCYV